MILWVLLLLSMVENEWQKRDRNKLSIIDEEMYRFECVRCHLVCAAVYGL